MRRAHLLLMVLIIVAVIIAGAVYFSYHKNNMATPQGILPVHNNPKFLQQPPPLTVSSEQARVDVQRCRPETKSGGWGLGSGYIKVIGFQEDKCLLHIGMEAELGSLYYLCYIPSTEKEVAIIWRKGALNSLFGTEYCTRVESKNRPG